LRVSFSRVLLVLVVLAGCGDIPSERDSARVSASSDVQEVRPTVDEQRHRVGAEEVPRVPQMTTTTTVPVWVAGKPFADAVIRQAIAVGRGSSLNASAIPAPAASSVPTSPQGYPTSVVPPELVPIAVCIVNHESAQAGVYRAVNPNGIWRGAYQMDRQFWLSYAPAEWKHLAGVHETAPPEAQDAAFVAGYRARGSQPWNGSGC
jgi:hypothetical protein